MKRYIMALLALSAILFSGCSQSNLEIEQKGVLNTESTYANASDDDAVALIASVYNTIWSGVYGTSIYLCLTTQDGDHMCGGGSYSDGATNRYNYYNAMTPSTGTHIAEYTQIYRAIYWSNMIVEKLNNSDNSPVKSRVIAEAKFARAISLMLGIKLFGTPPFVPTTDTEDPANGDPAEMWAWIEANLTEAAAVLPSKSGVNGQEAIGGRATKEAAIAYLGQAQLFQGKYAEASATLQKVKSSNLYALIPDFAELSHASSDFSSENIFEQNAYNDPTTYSTQNDLRCIYLHLRSSFINIASDGWSTGWGFCPPSYEFVQFMQKHEAVAGGYSARYHGSIISHNDYESRPGANGLAVSPFIDNCGYHNMKTMFWSEDKIAGSEAGHPRNARHHKNYVYLRYAEVLLDLAEAEAAQGKTTGVGLEALNMVRTRAGLAALSSMTLQDVKDEKRAELWGENGSRFFDLVRWGDAAEALKDMGKYRYEFYAPTRSTEVDADANYPIVSSKEEGEATGRKTFIVKYLDPIYGATAGFKTGKNEHWPFPESEVLINPNLEQNNGWK